jgi:DNA-binding winged helix-turn-helix (wHTH) protein
MFIQGEESFATRSEELVEFANFALNPAAHELRREGIVVPLQRIPCELLCLLLEHRARVITREEILQHVCGKGVFVDIENSINTAVRKLRRALDDDPDAPRFVITVPAKAYRFNRRDPRIEPPTEFAERRSQVRDAILATSAQYARSGNIHIAHQIFGDDGQRDIVMIPGTLSHLEIYWATPFFQHLLKRLTAFARAIVFDKRGQALRTAWSPSKLSKNGSMRYAP